MEIIEMFIGDDEEFGGIDAVSLVENPAIELDFVALSSKKIKLAEVSKEKRILMGAMLVPNQPIYRNQGGKEFYIFFSKETLRKALRLFFKNSKQNNATEEHSQKLSGCTITEAWIKEDDVHDKSALYNIEAPIGSIMCSMYCEDEQTYQKAKEGKLKGFSIEGYFTDQIEMSKLSDDEKKLSAIMEILKM